MVMVDLNLPQKESQNLFGNFGASPVETQKCIIFIGYDNKFIGQYDPEENQFLPILEMIDIDE